MKLFTAPLQSVTRSLTGATLLISFAVLFETTASLGHTVIGPDHFDSSATLIDFETGTTALPRVPGVVFVEEYYQGYGYVSGGAFRVGSRFFGNQYLTGFSSGGCLCYTGMAIEFLNPVEAVGGWVQHVGHDAAAPGVIVRAYDIHDQLIEQTTIDFPGNRFPSEPTFVGFHSDDLIQRIEWTATTWGFVGVDNIIFGDLNTVPEPASLGALSFIGGLYTLRRRRIR
jgi:hypothetical protein